MAVKLLITKARSGIGQVIGSGRYGEKGSGYDQGDGGPGWGGGIGTGGSTSTGGSASSHDMRRDDMRRGQGPGAMGGMTSPM